MNILGVIDKIDYCEWWRVLFPFAELRDHGIRADVTMYEKLRTIDTSQYDVIVTPRLTFGGNHWLNQWLRTAKKEGKRWLYEADDDLWNPEFVDRQIDLSGTIDRPERRRLRVKYENEREYRLRILERCDGITVATPALVNRIQTLTKTPVQLVPNLIDVEEFDAGYKLSERMVPKLTVGWMGGQRLDSDFELLGQVWHELALRYPQITFVVYGYKPKPLVDAVPEDRLATIKWAPIGLYPAGLKNIDIGCCFLPSTTWNACKSANKWMEFGLAKIPCVVSPTVYGEVVGDTALIATTKEEWVTHIEHLIEDAELRRELGTRARARVISNHSLSTGWLQWAQAYALLY